MTRRFTKTVTTISQQIAHLTGEGMLIADVKRAEHWLRHVSYYRLSAYWLPFEHPKGKAGPRFLPGANFDAIIALYEFDRKLRLLVLDAVERVEVALRGSWAYALAKRGGSHGYLNASLYSDRRFFHENLSRLARGVGTSPETYIDHYRRTYHDPAMPPVWMVAEMMSFGQLSRWYSSLDDRALRNEIARPLGLSETILVPLLKHLSTVRNSCAHHARLWNRGFLIRMKLPIKPASLHATLAPLAGPGPAMLYNSLVLIRYMLQEVEPASTWLDQLKALVKTHPVGDLAAMGFPADWERRPLWS
jgi:abortive infection bacteriophage resistance protein